MEFTEVLRRRRMVRHFTDEPVEADVVERILAAGLRAPSAGFSQGYALLLLESPEDRARFWATESEPDVPMTVELAETQAAMRRAQVLVPVLGSKDAYLDRYARPDKGWVDRDEARWPVPYWYVDAGFMALLMLLAAVDEGVGAVFFGIPPSDIPAFRAEFGVPEDYTPIGCVAIGHEDPAVPRRDLRSRRRPAGDVVRRGGW
ncbi:MAG: nitroreductase family protein [Acidimicrobiales bacterium]